MNDADQVITASAPRLTFSRPLLLLCAGILLATLLSAAICQHIIVNNLHARGDQYGQALANLGARQAIDATLNHDLVSLQVLLSDIAENSTVAQAAIYDVENNLLVQAGNALNRRVGGEHWRNYTAPITLHNSIAGYVTVTIDFSHTLQVQHQLYWLFGFMAALLLALTLSALYFGRSWHMPINLPRVALPIVDTPPEPVPAAEPLAKTPQRAFPGIELTVQLHNLRELRNQLNNQSFRHLSQRLEQHLRGVLALYAGHLIQLDGDQIRIRFHDDEADESAFNALCAAGLLCLLNRESKGVQLRISALLRRRASEAAMLKNLPFELQDSDELDALLRHAADDAILIDSNLVTDTELSRRAATEAMDEAGDILRLVEWHEPYRSLLAKQLQQLQRR